MGEFLVVIVGKALAVVNFEFLKNKKIKKLELNSGDFLEKFTVEFLVQDIRLVSQTPLQMFDI